MKEQINKLKKDLLDKTEKYLKAPDDRFKRDLKTDIELMQNTLIAVEESKFCELEVTEETNVTDKAIWYCDGCGEDLTNKNTVKCGIGVYCMDCYSIIQNESPKKIYFRHVADCSQCCGTGVVGGKECTKCKGIGIKEPKEIIVP